MTGRGAWWTMAMATGMVAASASAAPAATPAGTQIANTARLTLGADAASLVIDSNTVTIAVDALVDAAIAADRATVSVTGAAPLPVAFTVTNPGNVAGRYDLTASTDRDGVVVAAIVADTDGDGRYDPASDLPVTAVTLAAGASQRIFLLVSGAAAGATITATATATSDTNATLGTTGGRATASVRLVAGGDGPAARLDKAQAVVAPDGGTRAVAGAIVTYSMTARFARDCAAVELADAVPEGMRYVPGSIALDDQPLSDGTDGDPGRLDGDTIRVTLGDMPAGAVRSIRFKAIIL